MTVILPLLAFLGLWIYSGNTRREPLWRASFIQAFILWGAWMVFVTELLSLFTAVTRTSLSLAWGLPVLAFVYWLVRWLKGRKVLRLPVVYRARDQHVALLDLLLLIIMLIPLVIGFIAPPNSQEALNFGMVRVAHWGFQHSLAHFPAVNENLNSAPPGMGIGLLNFYLLSGSDRWANFLSWFALLGCLQAAMAIARLFGASPTGTRLTAIFAATIPAALALSSSSLDDLLSCLWVLSYVMVVFYFKKDKNHEFNLTLTALAAGLTLITKPVSLLFILPFAIYFLFLQVKLYRWGKTLPRVAISLLLILAVAGGFFYRNFQSYGTAYQVQALTQDLNETISWRVAISNGVRNFALHADLPFPRADAWLTKNIALLHTQLGLDASDPRTTYGGTFRVPDINTSEVTSGNPLHAILIILCVFYLVGRFLLTKTGHEATGYTGLLMISVLLYVVFLKWRINGSAWQLPFFLMTAPVVGFVFDYLRQEHKYLGTVLAFLLILFAIPWLLCVQQRPLIPISGLTYQRSILATPREALYFTTEPEVAAEMSEISNLISERLPKTVELRVEPDFPEYVLWALPGQDDAKIEFFSISTGPDLTLPPETSIVPDLILTQDCQGVTPVGMTLIHQGLYCLYTIN